MYVCLGVYVGLCMCMFDRFYSFIILPVDFHILISCIPNIYIYIYVCVCVCVCVLHAVSHRTQHKLVVQGPLFLGWEILGS